MQTNKFYSKIFMVIIAVILQSACGNKNLTESKVDKTPDEKIRIALDAEDYDLAKQLLEDQIEAYPEEYKRHAILSAVYAALAGFDLLGAVKQNQGGSSSSNALDAVSIFLTEETNDENLGYMDQAVTILQEIPEELRTITSEEAYSSSAILQLTLYQAAYAVMTLNQFIQIDPNSSEIDLDRLREMSDEEAEIILTSLIGAASSSPEGAAIGGSLEKTLEAIDAAEGETTREQLINYLATQ